MKRNGHKQIKSIKDLQPDVLNANKGTPRGLQMVEDSLRTYGAGRSILVDKQGRTIAGNKTLQSASDIDLPIRVVETDGKELVVVQRTDLDLNSKKARELGIADNRSSQVGLEWDADILSHLKDEGVELSGMFTEKELAALLPQGESKDAEPQIDKAAELQQKWQVATGEILTIGPHVLLCGDSGLAGDVFRLMGDKRAALCLTDPPYGIGEHYVTHSDTSGELAKLIGRFLPLARSVADVTLLTPGNSNQRLYPEPDWTLCWFVAAGTGMNRWGFTCWQPVLAFGKDPFLARGLGSRPDALSMTESADNALGHPCSKPVGVWSWFLERGSVVEGDLIYEPFAGSGTTLVAAENLNRTCYAMEISPEYCAVTLERMVTAFPHLEIKREEAAVAA